MISGLAAENIQALTASVPILYQAVTLIKGGPLMPTFMHYVAFTFTETNFKVKKKKNMTFYFVIPVVPPFYGSMFRKANQLPSMLDPT